MVVALARRPVRILVVDDSAEDGFRDVVRAPDGLRQAALPGAAR